MPANTTNTTNTTTTTTIPSTAHRTTLDPSIRAFLSSHPMLHLGGGAAPFTDERAHHQRVYGLHNLPRDGVHPIGSVEFTALRGPHGTIPVRVLYPASGEEARGKGEAGALVCFHSGGYTVGSVDEFENGLRAVAEGAGVQVYAVDYRLAPEHKFPVQLDEYAAAVDALQDTDFGASRGVRPDRGSKNLAGQVLLYPEAHLPFDTPAAAESNSGYYLECNDIFFFAGHYLPRGVPPAHEYISPGMQTVDCLREQPPAAVFTSGFDPLRDVGVEYARKLGEAGDEVRWRHYERMPHGWLQMTAWSEDAVAAVRDVAEEVRRLAYSA